jgi:hypothetical protein
MTGGTRAPDDTARDIVEVDLDALLAQLSFAGGVPDDETAAAIASAVGAHLSDRHRAVAGAETARRETVDDWTFRNRRESVGARPRRCPTGVERGSEWRAAARSL